MRIDGVKLTGGAFLLAVGVLLWWAVRASGGLPVPASPYTEGLALTADPGQPNLMRPDLSNVAQGVVFTQHRYPRVCGQELSAIIHYGHSRASVPSTRDSNWITSPPSEVTI